MNTFTTFYFATLIEFCFLSRQFNILKLNVFDGMTNLEQEHRLVVAFELKNGMEELEIWDQGISKDFLCPLNKLTFCYSIEACKVV